MSTWLLFSHLYDNYACICVIVSITKWSLTFKTIPPRIDLILLVLICRVTIKLWLLIYKVHPTNHRYVRIYVQYIPRIMKTNTRLYSVLKCTVDVSVCRHFSLSTFWSVDVWYVDVLVCRRFSLSTFWSVDVSVCRRFGLPMGIQNIYSNINASNQIFSLKWKVSLGGIELVRWWHLYMPQHLGCRDMYKTITWFQTNRHQLEIAFTRCNKGFIDHISCPTLIMNNPPDSSITSAYVILWW